MRKICLIAVLIILSLQVGITSPHAESMIRIIGDKTTKDPESSATQIAPEPLASPEKGSGTIHIIGDKPSPIRTRQKNRMEPVQTASPEKRNRDGIQIKNETAQKKATVQPVSSDFAVKETAAMAAEEARRARETAEKRIARQAEEEHTAREEAQRQHKAEQEKQDADATRQATIRLEQKLLAVRKAEELRKAAEKAELERVEALKADEERLSAARKALAEKMRSAGDAPLPEGSVTLSLPTSSGSSLLDPSTKSDNSTAQAPFTIWDLYLSAKAIDPSLGRTEARVSGSKADSDLLLSALLPHLNSSAGIKQISQSLTNYSATDSSYDFTAFNYNVTAQMTLLHVPTLYSLSAAAAGLSGEQAGVTAARQNLIVKITDSYFALLKAQTDKQIAVGEINRLKLVLDQSQAFLKAGTGDVIAVYEAQSRLDGAEADLTRSESNLRLAEQKLSTMVGKPVSSIVNYLPQQPAGPEPDNIDWWITTMEKEQPLVQQAREGFAQTTEQRKAAKSEYLPILQLTGGYDVNRGTAALPTAEVKQWFVGASISLPLYSGGETSAKVRRAVASEEERRHIFNETLDQQRENVKQAYFNLRYNISLIKALEQKKASAEIQLSAVKKGRKIGTRNAIDVLNADQGYSLALRDYRYAQYDNIIRVIQLKSAAGILKEVDVSMLAEMIAPTPDYGLNMVVSKIAK
jgi:outer membrane protein